MKAQPGCRIVVFPTFHIGGDLAKRIALASGIDRREAVLVPRLPWRAPNDQEQQALLGAPAIEDLKGCVCVFKLPHHLRSAWWRVLEQVDESGSLPAEGFAGFAAEVSGFLGFKEIAVPEGASMELVVGKPGQCALHGLSFSGGGAAFLWGWINLGDEATSLVFVNAPKAAMPSPVEECPDYPVVRLRIEPGEGFRLPAGGILVDGYTLDNQEPVVLMMIRKT